MLHGIHAILLPPEVMVHNGFDPVAEKKWLTVTVSGTSTRRYWAGT